MNVPRLLLLTDRSQLPPRRGLIDTVRACAGAGLTHVVVREHDLPALRRQRLVAALAAVDGLTVLSSRLPAEAAAGLHLAAAQARPSCAWFGRSCHDLGEVRRAAEEGAAYVTLSPFAATASKPGYGPPVARVDYAGHHGVPVLALGGVDHGNAADARAAGAHGVAVMGGVMRADDPAAVVRALLREVGP
jgi:thiamine-phosphate pyrophosphorylase